MVSNKLIPFKRTYRKSDFGVTDKVLTANEYVQIGSVTVPAQQEIAFGSNESYTGRVQGAPVYLDIKNSSPAQIPGVVRFVMSNANDTTNIVVMEESIERLSSDISDRTKAVLFPETLTRVKEDSKLKILFKADSGDTMTAADSTFSIPVTVYQ